MHGMHAPTYTCMHAYVYACHMHLHTTPTGGGPSPHGGAPARYVLRAPRASVPHLTGGMGNPGLRELTGSFTGVSTVDSTGLHLVVLGKGPSAQHVPKSDQVNSRLENVIGRLFVGGLRSVFI